MIKKFDFVFASYDIVSNTYDKRNYTIYYDEDNDENNIQTIHFHIEFLTDNKKERKIEIIIPKNNKKDELHFELKGKKNVIKTKETGISFHIRIKNITESLKGDNKIEVIIDDFASAQLNAYLMGLPLYAYNKQTKEIEEYIQKKDDQFDTNIFISPFGNQINSYKNIVKNKEKIMHGNDDILFNSSLKNNTILESLYYYFFTKEKEKKEIGELLFQTRIWDKFYWIPIWRNLGNFKENPKKLKVNETNIEKSEKYKQILMQSNLKVITKIFLDLDINNDQKIEYINELSMIFDERERKMLQELTKEKLIENNDELLNIQLINILITLRNIMKERLDYLEKKKWSLAEYTDKIVEEYRKNRFKDVSEDIFSSSIRKREKDKININTFDEEDNIKKKVWIFNEDGNPEINENNNKVLLYNFSEIKQDNDLKEFEINKEIISYPKFENLLNINEYIDLYKKLISMCQAFPFLINKLNDKESSNIFNLLYSIYLISQKNEKSIITREIKNYHKSFNYLCNILHTCEVDLSEFRLKIEEKSNQENDIINLQSLPVNIPQNEWNIINEKKKNNNYSNVNLQNLEKDDIYSSKIFSNSIYQNQPTKNIKKKIEKKNIKFIAKDKYQEKKFIYHNYNTDDDDNDDEENDNENEETKIYLKEIEKMEKILNEDLIKQKNKTENIKQIISKMKKMNNITLRLPDEFDEEIPKEHFEKYYNKDDKNKFPISILKQISQKLAIKFYQASIDTQKDLNQICCVIAIDCSRTIKLKNKILHLFLA